MEVASLERPNNRASSQQDQNRKHHRDANDQTQHKPQFPKQWHQPPDLAEIVAGVGRDQLRRPRPIEPAKPDEYADHSDPDKDHSLLSDLPQQETQSDDHDPGQQKPPAGSARRPCGWLRFWFWVRFRTHANTGSATGRSTPVSASNSASDGLIVAGSSTASNAAS